MMTSSVIARPYARAAFEEALSRKDLRPWEIMLNEAAMIASDPSVKKLLSKPGISRNQLAEFFCDILKQHLNEERRNFIFLLAENKRLPALPQMAELFKQYKTEHEKVLKVKVMSAVSLDDKYKQKLLKTLNAHFGQDVLLDCEVDPNLLGGIVVQAGDTVIDGSVRGKLHRLLETIQSTN